MPIPIDPRGGSDLEMAGEAREAEEEAHRALRERVLEEVRRLAQAEQFAAALQALRDSGLASADPAGLQPEIARLKQAVRLQASYQRAREALQAGDGQATALLSAIVAVAPAYKDAARLLYETVSGVSVGGLTAEVAASREAASQLEAERNDLARRRARLAWIVGAQSVLLCLLLGWVSWHRPASPAAERRRSARTSSGGARIAPTAQAGSPSALSPVPPPSPAPTAAMTAPAARESASSAPSAAETGASPADPPPPEIEGPCHHIGESCASTGQCCFGSMCYGTTCQDTRRTILFGQYRP